MTVAAKKKAVPKKRKPTSKSTSRKSTAASKRRSVSKEEQSLMNRRMLFSPEDEDEEEDCMEMEETNEPEQLFQSCTLPQWLLAQVACFLVRDPPQCSTTQLWAPISAIDMRRGQRQLMRACMVCKTWRDAFMSCHAGWQLSSCAPSTRARRTGEATDERLHFQAEH